MPAPIITTAAFVWPLLPTGTFGHGFEPPIVASFSRRQTHPKKIQLKLKRYEYGKQCALAGTKPKKKREEKKRSRYASHMHPMLQGGTCAARGYLTHGQQAFTGPCHRLLLLRKTPTSILNRVIGFRRASILIASPVRPLGAKTIAARHPLWYPLCIC